MGRGHFVSTLLPAKKRWPALRRVGALFFVMHVCGCGGPRLDLWHSVRLTHEFSAAKAGEVRSFADYLALEDELFDELDEKVYARVGTGPGYELMRYSAGSASDPRDDEPNWNRSFEFTTDEPVGGVLLLHGMSDSPYSLRALALALAEQGYQVVGLRLPGHGTVPSGLKYVTARDMRLAVSLGMAHLRESLGGRPIHVVGYSTGASLALSFTLDALDGIASPVPASLVLISPAIRIHRIAALASFKDALSIIPGLGELAWLNIAPEFDPYRYHSFAANAGDVVHRLTRSVDDWIAARSRTGRPAQLPPILVLKSAVDSTVTTEAVVDHLLARLAPHQHELVLFDINRFTAKSMFLVSDPGPLTDRLIRDAALPFAVTLVANADPGTTEVVVRRKAPFSTDFHEQPSERLEWPPAVLSLSHVALPIAPDDPLYGSLAPEDERRLFLGDLVLRGEHGLQKLPAAWLLRMRYNPFYSVLETRVLEWFERGRR
jgi:alpha-beta hydrolase superfamily lysophospholipase